MKEKHPYVQAFEHAAGEGFNLTVAMEMFSEMDSSKEDECRTESLLSFRTRLRAQGFNRTAGFVEDVLDRRGYIYET